MELVREVLPLLEDLLSPPPDQPVLRFLQPRELQGELGLELGEAGDPEEAMAGLGRVAARSVRTCHPAFINQLYGGLDHFGLAGEVLAAALNTNQYTYEVAPVLTLCELEVIKRVLSLIGFNGGDGLFSPGGSISNMYGIVLARYKKFPDVKTKGLSGLPAYVLFTSQDSHYSITKGSHWLGLGTDNVIKVETDARGRMIPGSLEAAILKSSAEGKVPLFVNATAGTTVLGAFDPFIEIADICNKYGLWMHVDACWGGSVLFSKTHSKLLRGIERADSLSWNPHKMLGAPLQCSLFLTKEKALLKDANCAGAKYLFQQDKMYDVSFDSGDKSLQCGRKTDALKLWTMWKARGDSGFAHLVDHTFLLAKYFLEQIRNKDGFKLVLNEFDCTNICFWYIPIRLRNKGETESWWNEVYSIAPKLKERLVLNGKIMIGYQPLSHKQLGNFFRFVLTAHPHREYSFIDYIVQTIDQCGQDL